MHLPKYAGGLSPLLHLSVNARVILTANLWTQAGLVNGPTGCVKDISYQHHGPPSLPLAVIVKFDKYSGATLGGKNCFPIIPVERSWRSGDKHLCRTQIPVVRLALAITIHNSQGRTLDKAIIDLGEKEFATGLSFVALSWVRQITDCLIQRIDYERLRKLSNQKVLKLRRQEDERLSQMPKNTHFQHLARSESNIRSVSDDTGSDDIAATNNTAPLLLLMLLSLVVLLLSLFLLLILPLIMSIIPTPLVLVEI